VCTAQHCSHRGAAISYAEAAERARSQRVPAPGCRAPARLPGSAGIATLPPVKLEVRHAGGELTVGSQKEFLLLWQRGVIAPDDLVRREGQERWTAAADLPWIRGMRLYARKDSRRFFWLTLALMLLGLAGALWVQGHAPQVVRRAGPPPSGAVRAIPR